MLFLRPGGQKNNTKVIDNNLFIKVEQTILYHCSITGWRVCCSPIVEAVSNKIKALTV